MPADRRALELQHVVAAIARQDISEFTLTAKSADDPKMQVLQKWVHATVDSLIDMTAAMDNYDFIAKGRIILLTMKLTNLFSAFIFHWLLIKAELKARSGISRQKNSNSIFDTKRRFALSA